MERFAADSQLLAAGVLVAARVLPLTLLSPWLSLRLNPGWTGFVAALALAVALTPGAVAAAAPLPLHLSSLGALALREAVIGAVYGLAVALPIHALSWAGRFIEQWRGGSLHPAPVGLDGGPAQPLSDLLLWIGVIAFFAIGGHRVVIASLDAAFTSLPVGGAAPLSSVSAAAFGSARLMADAFALAVSVALPAAVALVAAELCVAFVARAASGIDLHGMLVPLRAGLGLAVVLMGSAVLLGELPRVFRAALSGAESVLAP